MKKALVWMLAVCALLPGFALAEVDLSGMSFEELIALREQVNQAIWRCDEWQEVTVPMGIWEVGVDIPEGHWTISAAEGTFARIYWGTDNHGGVEVSTDLAWERVCSPSYKDYDEASDRVSVDWELKAGQFIEIHKGKAVFSPFTGKPDLGFK